MLYERVLRGFDDGLAIRPIKEKPKRIVAICWKDRKTLSLAARKFLEHIEHSSVYARYHLSTFTGTQAASLYVVGTLEGSTFMPTDTYLTCTVPTEEDGLTYMLLGTMTSASPRRFVFFSLPSLMLKRRTFS